MIGDAQRRPVAAGATDLVPEVRAALVQLAKAWDYAHQMRVDPWQFAVEIERLIADGSTTSDLRFLVGSGYAEHALEITRPGDTARRFRPSPNTAFTPRTCFVLTDAGLSVVNGEATAPAILQFRGGGGLRPTTGAPVAVSLLATPHWDPDRRVLSLGGRVVKQYRVPSPNQEAVLAAFQEEGWPRCVDDPLRPGPDVDSKERLHGTIKALNASQKNRLIRFHGNGTGQRVRWEPMDEEAGCLAAFPRALRAAA